MYKDVLTVPCGLVLYVLLIFRFKILGLFGFCFLSFEGFCHLSAYKMIFWHNNQGFPLDQRQFLCMCFGRCKKMNGAC